MARKLTQFILYSAGSKKEGTGLREKTGAQICHHAHGGMASFREGERKGGFV